MRRTSSLLVVTLSAACGDGTEVGVDGIAAADASLAQPVRGAHVAGY